ncbi:MAG: hypothetical protein ABI885_24165 [Gammaproteobacteria bacterium]
MLTSVFDRLYLAINRARETGARCTVPREEIDVAIAQVEQAQRYCQGLASADNAARALEQLNLAAERLRCFEGELEESDRAVAELRGVLTEALQGLSRATTGAPAADSENPPTTESSSG